ncbi:MAG: ABC transporter permease [Terriglobia bacterium]|jgi:putative ABC transport system permease protein
MGQTASLPHALPARSNAGSGAWVTTREAFWIAVEALRAHKLRTFLTLLGVVIATTTLIVVMSIINGMNLYIADHIANLGANVFIVHRLQWAQGYEARLKAMRRNKPIRIEEFEFLRDNLKDYRNIGAEADLQTINSSARYQNHSVYDVDIAGITPNMIDIGEQKVESGRYVTESDYQHESMVCFIGQDLVDAFFPSVDPLDKEIMVNGIPFRVVGVAEKIGSTFGQSQDNFVQIPLTTYRKFFSARPALLVNVQAWDAEQMLTLEDQTRALLRARRHVPYREDDTFGIDASDTIMETWHQITAAVFGVTIGVVAVFMVVGGIVIMNIMLASVTERTHEIGIRKSLGARRRDILTQFVIESSVMAGLGGGLGVLLALMVSEVVNLLVGPGFFNSSIPLSAVLVGLVLSVSVGLFFGIYPASQAAKLDPIEALRTEN